MISLTLFLSGRVGFYILGTLLISVVSDYKSTAASRKSSKLCEQNEMYELIPSNINYA
jgi:hypothetical protein